MAAPLLRWTAPSNPETLAMAADAAIFVSKRLQRAAFAVLCIMLAQFVLASCQAEPTPMAARQAVSF